MIVYDKLWLTMQAKGITQYDLYTYHGIRRSTLDKLRHNKNVEIITINKLCHALDCAVEDILTYIPDD